jgi:hypothetical protein
MFYSRQHRSSLRILLKETLNAKRLAYLNNYCLKIPFLTEVLIVLLQKHVGG